MRWTIRRLFISTGALLGIFLLFSLIFPNHFSKKQKTIFVITPTYSRPVQKAELTRLSHTFRLVDNLFWIVVEDSDSRSELVGNLLQNSGIPYKHLNVPTPEEWKPKPGEKKWRKPRGVLQRNAGLKWLKDSSHQSGIVYFADDDNTYDLELFKQMRSISKVGIWPVAFVGELMVEKPLLQDGKVIGWDVAVLKNRPFALDMAGFAVNLDLIREYPNAEFSLESPVGHQESHLLQALNVRLEDLEPKAEMCTRMLVWHTKTQEVNLIQERKWAKEGKSSYRDIEV